MVVPRIALAPGHAGQRVGQHPGDVRRDLRRRVAHPVGDDADLRVGQIGNHVARQPAPRQIAAPPPAAASPAMTTRLWRARPGDQTRDHGVAPVRSRVRRRRAAQPAVGVQEEGRARHHPIARAQSRQHHGEPLAREGLADLDRSLLELLTAGPGQHVGALGRLQRSPPPGRPAPRAPCWPSSSQPTWPGASGPPVVGSARATRRGRRPPRASASTRKRISDVERSQRTAAGRRA